MSYFTSAMLIRNPCQVCPPNHTHTKKPWQGFIVRCKHVEDGYLHTTLGCTLLAGKQGGMMVCVYFWLSHLALLLSHV